jgi:hypothetical protein
VLDWGLHACCDQRMVCSSQRTIAGGRCRQRRRVGRQDRTRAEQRVHKPILARPPLRHPLFPWPHGPVAASPPRDAREPPPLEHQAELVRSLEV